MVIDVSQQLREPVGSMRHYSFDRRGASPDREDAYIGEVSLLRTDGGIFVRGILHINVEAVCSRCLCSYEQPLTLKIEEEFLLTADPSTGASLPWTGEEGSFTINEKQEIDLAEAVRQYSLLALPLMPLCRQDCRGLCPSCGHNLNLGPCSCPPDLDPRFAKLAGLGE